MNIPIAPSAHGLDDLFFRAADRMRVEGCVNAVANEGLSLALLCVHEALLDHYVQQLLQRLQRHAPQHHLEVYFPANSESLIARFNEVLAGQSVRDATRQGSERPSAQIWLVHDAQTLPEQELQLLARLIQNFPGANIRAILLMVGQAPDSQTLSAFGRKLLRWDIEPPTEEQAEATLELARLHGQEDALRLMLRRMGKRRLPATGWADGEGDAHVDTVAMAQPGLPVPEAMPLRHTRRWSLKLPPFALGTLLQRLRLPLRLPLPTPAAALAVAAAPQAVNPGATWTTQAPAQRRWLGLPSLSTLRQRSPLLVAGAGALALSVLIMMWIQPASFGLKGKGRSTVAAEAPAPHSNPAEAAKALGAQTPVVSVTAAPVPPPPTDVPDPAAEAQAWLRAMPPQQFVIQHGALPTFEKAQQMLNAYASLREARIVAIYRPGDKLAQFVVVSGPYEGAGKAYERFGRKDLPSTSWVRTAQSLQQQLEPTAKETR